MKETREEIRDSIEIVVSALYEKLDYLKEHEPSNTDMIGYVRTTIQHLTDFQEEFES